jgi:hypothetical protein
VESTVGTEGTLGSTGVVVVLVAFGVLLVECGVVGLRPGVVVFGVEVPVPGVVVAGVLPGRCEGRTCVDGRRTATSLDLAAVVALFSLAITGTATVTTDTAATMKAANHNFLNALSWERETRCSDSGT